MKWSITIVLGLGTLSSATAQPGALDLNFDADGVTTVQLSGTSVFEAFENVQEGPDGKIYACGNTLGGSDDHGHLARFLSDGSIDPTFGLGGTTNSSPYDEGYGRFNCMAIQADGKVLVAGQADLRGVVVRYLSNGTLDGSFGVGGVVWTDSWDIRVLNLGSSDRINAAGHKRDSENEMILVTYRFMPTGSPDLDFSFDGAATLDFFESDPAIDACMPMTIGTDNTGCIWIGARGDFGIPGGYRSCNMLVKFDNNGLLDPSFNSTGVDTFTIAGDAYEVGVHGLEILADGRLLLAGRGTNSFLNSEDGYLKRIFPTGAADPTFGTNGVVETATNLGLSVQSDGRILTIDSYGIRRFTPSGQLDLSFGVDGLVQPIAPFVSLTIGISLDAQFRILTCGTHDNNGTRRSYIARLLNDQDIGIPEFTAATNTLIYPNPITEHAEFTFELKNEERLTADILDVQGKLVHTVFSGRSFPSGTHKIPVDLADFAAGTYRLVLSNGAGQQAIQLVKQ